MRQLKTYGVTVLCANMDTSSEPTLAGLTEKSKIFVIDGHKIGIIGYIGADADVSLIFILGQVELSLNLLNYPITVYSRYGKVKV